MSETTKMWIGLGAMALSLLGLIVIGWALWQGLRAIGRMFERMARRTRNAARTSWGKLAEHYKAQAARLERRRIAKKEGMLAMQTHTAHIAVQLAADVQAQLLRLQCKLDEAELATRVPGNRERSPSDTILPS